MFFVDLEKLGRQWLQGDHAQQLRKLAESQDGRKLAETLDVSRLQKAASQGDSQVLNQALQQILATPEGRRLAEQVKKAVEG